MEHPGGLLQSVRFISLIIGCLFITSVNNAQSISRYTINSGGNQLINDHISLSTSIGQAGLVGTKQLAGLTFNIGFQQMESPIATSIPWRQDGLQINVFPNPFMKTFSVLLEPKKPVNLQYKILDSSGKTILYQKALSIPKRGVPIQVNVTDTSPGMYFLELEIQKLTGEVSSSILPIVLIQ